MFKVLAAQISDSIDLDSFMMSTPDELLYSDHLELFYEVDTEVYVSVFRYGVVCFFNYDDKRTTEFTDLISHHCNYFYDSEFIKEYFINSDASETKFGVKKADLTYFDIETLRVIMLNLAQSVALDYYFQKVHILLEQTNKHTVILEKKGNLTISDKKLKKLTGKTHNLKNHIVENLNISHSFPDSNQIDYIMSVDREMKTSMYMERRFSNIYKELEIINEHLIYFSNLINHGSSMKLEWIIIVLLAIFVIDILIGYII